MDEFQFSRFFLKPREYRSPNFLGDHRESDLTEKVNFPNGASKKVQVGERLIVEGSSN